MFTMQLIEFIFLKGKPLIASASDNLSIQTATTWVHELFELC